MSTYESFDSSAKLNNQALEMINAIRQNHALEHATIALLFKRLEGKVRLIGRAGLGSFHIYGDIPTDIIEEAAREALQRLQEGDEELAVSPMCGTNLVVSGILAGLASIIAGRKRRGLSKLSSVIQASIIAMLIAQPLGRLVQKHLTTTADLTNVSIMRVVKSGEGKLTRHKIEIANL